MRIRRGGWGVLLIIGLAVALTGSWAEAAKPKVAVLPFLVHAKPEEQAKLQETLQKTILSAIVNPGLEVIPAEQVAQVAAQPSLDPAAARKAGGSLGADYVLFGSLTKLGKRFSLDARLLKMEAGAPKSFFQRGDGDEALKDMVAVLARDLRGELLEFKKVTEVVVRGNKRIEAEAITVLMKTRAGQFLDPETLNQDLKKIFAMGYFADVKALTEDIPAGVRAVIQIAENPAIREVEITGKGTLDQKKVLEAFNVPALTVFNGQAVANGVERVANLYRANGYLNAEVSYKLGEVKDGLSTLTLEVQPNNRVYIKDIKFEGNHQVKSEVLRKQMETKDWGIFSFMTDSGILKREVLDKDLEKIRAYYQNNGFLKAQVGEPKIEITKTDIFVTVPVDEGDQYKIGQVTMSGELIKSDEDLRKVLKQTPGKVYNRAQIDEDRQALSEIYSGVGYAKVNVGLKPDLDTETKTVALAYTIKKGDLIYVEAINIHGNTRTRDKVIRRELKIHEGDLISLPAIRRSAFNLRRLMYFEEVEFNQLPGRDKDKVVLDVKVKEKPTGLFNFGVGYSTAESAMIMMRVEEQNLFGRGQTLAAAGAIGFKGQRFSISFTEPYLMDKRLSLSTSVYNVQRDYLDYSKLAYGGSLGLGWPIFNDDTQMSLKYTVEEAEISNVNSTDSILASQKGWHSTSMVSWGIRRDTRDLPFGATSGSENFIDVDFAGLGGSNAYTRIVAGSGWYIPFPLKTTFHVQGKIGYIVENSWGQLPAYEKFYLGGINTLRGFKYQGVSPVDPVTGERIGGEYMAFANAELIFPLIPSAGIKGIVFYDVGNAWPKSIGWDFSDVRMSVGAGVHWYSPIGPLRLEYGWVVKGKPGDGSGGWEFTIGSVF